jgi:hypothetical protein
MALDWNDLHGSQAIYQIGTFLVEQALFFHID